jgi:sulfatase modifying factor 1
MKKLSISFIILLISYAVLFSANDKLYEIDGRIVDIHNKTNGPKALVKLSYGTEKNNSDLEQVYSIRDSFQISLKDSIYWLEMEKNTDYTICIEEANEGLWKGNDFSYKKEQNCILLNSGNYVKNGKIWYVTKFGNVFTFNILVGMKYIDLSTQEHLLGGYSGNNKDRKRLEPTIMAYKPSDPVRFEMINEVLVVDKYKVTECEFIQSLWDSIPAQTSENFYSNNNYWIKKKKSMVKNGLCDTHDSAAVRIYLYQALVYANNRSLQDGFKPVYILEETKEKNLSFNAYNDGSFNIVGFRFFPDSADGKKYYHVKIDKDADGYRLPYYDEWTALARGGKGYESLINFWERSKDSLEATKYAWFGQKDPEDKYLKMDEKDGIEGGWLRHSCGEWSQKSRPVGMLKPNAYGLYDIQGLVCENVLMPGKSLFGNEVYSCRGGFLTTSFKNLKIANHCDDYKRFSRTYQGLRLVRQIK